jgi:protein-L-isoaspartate(D-aspartate) O-methyltransferase
MLLAGFLIRLAIGLSAMALLLPAAARADGEEEARLAMVRTIEEIAAAPDELSVDPTVLAVMRKVPRHAFVPEDERRHAYEDRPLPIGHGQTISQPYVVALMTSLLQVKPGQRVLELGTGSGYQAAVLGALGASVRSIEIVPELAASAKQQLDALRLGDISTRQGDGYYGWPEEAPFDAIMVTAAAVSIPPPLVEQLKPGGRMVIPVGAPFMVQQLTIVEKDAAGRIHTEALVPVSFVPLVHRE